MADELRDRIAEVIYHEDVVHICPEPADLVALSVLSPGEQATYRDLAQAIIDDLHLEAYDFTRHDGSTTKNVHGWWTE